MIPSSFSLEPQQSLIKKQESFLGTFLTKSVLQPDEMKKSMVEVLNKEYATHQPASTDLFETRISATPN